MESNPSNRAPRLATRHITKSFGGVQALRGISLELAPGEIHAIVGENGAGKSTLMRILAGHMPPDSGEIQLGGQVVSLRSPHDALARGIAMIHQEPLGVPELTVAENVFLGCEPGVGPGGWLNPRRERQEASALFARLRLPLDPVRRFRGLGLAQQQTVEIARALAQRARILILDEPTSAISRLEIQALFSLIRELRHTGTTILYISHRLEEVLELADRVTVLRDGEHVTTAPAARLEARQLVTLMVGRELSVPAPVGSNLQSDVALEVRHLERAQTFWEVSLSIRCGEVVGLAGLMGAGRTEVASALYGLTPAERGEILVRGRPVQIPNPATALANGIAMVTEDRHLSGLVPRLAVEENLALSSLGRWCRGPWVRAGRVRAMAGEQMRNFAIKASGPSQPVRALSGGNQQKVLLARALLTGPHILLLDEPTRGIDVAAKQEIHAWIRRLAARGLAVLLISSELPELLALSHRVLVMRQGRLVAELDARQASPDEILRHAMLG